ncbi:DUF3667 domain-containing protein [Spongiimicrobium salis]|uniref:DUF3667 domain-containing protein n=1 Tax=Spongiimicrobium salis TaxID=1667022 RepID=UPI00374DB9DB
MSDKTNLTPVAQHLKYRGTQCLNCGHPLDISDKYCPNCSQKNSTKKLSIKDFFDEFFANLISYDSKLLKTLTALLLRPGQITRDYIQGKRVSYTNPFRFLLSLSIVYFLLFNFSGNISDLDRFGGLEDNLYRYSNIGEDAIPSGDQLNFDLTNEEETQKAIQVLDSLNFQENILKNSKRRDSLIKADPEAYFKKIETTSFIESHFKKQEFFSTLIRDEKHYNFDSLISKYPQIEVSFSNRLAFNTARSFIRAAQQPGTFISAIISRLPFATFFFLPFFAIFIWVAYIRKKYNYTDHLIFSFHNQSLFFILLIVSFLVDSIFKTESGGIFILIFCFYLYKAMRKFYEQGRFKTIVKYVFLNTIFFILAMLSAVMLFVGSAFTY